MRGDRKNDDDLDEGLGRGRKGEAVLDLEEYARSTYLREGRRDSSGGWQLMHTKCTQKGRATEEVRDMCERWVQRRCERAEAVCADAGGWARRRRGHA